MSRLLNKMRRPHPLLALIALLALGVTSLSSSFEFSGNSNEQPIKWPTRTIQIALSTSLLTPGSAIKPESDVKGAVQRALDSWAAAANVTFVEVSSNAQSISPTTGGDGINLITIAPTVDNLAVFGEGNNPARTRVFYDPETGEISEADIVINAAPHSSEDAPLQFSTDGSSGTYDLESTLAHEIGHLLGLSHSNVIAATMQASQGLNGTYGLPALTERSLSEPDLSAIRSLYGSREKSGSIEGRILNSIDGKLLPAVAAHIWIEDLATGGVIASGLTTPGGRFRIDGVPTGNYRAMVEYRDGPGDEPSALSVLNEQQRLRQRAFRSVEIKSRLRVAAEKITSLNYILVPPQNFLPALNPGYIGINGELSTVPVPVKAGTKFTLYIGGEGVDQVPGSGFSTSSPFITVDAASLTLQHFGGSTPVVSFEVTVAPNAPSGDYSIRLQSHSGEMAYLVGGLTMNPAN